jgi:hypothetical protein
MGARPTSMTASLAAPGLLHGHLGAIDRYAVRRPRRRLRRRGSRPCNPQPVEAPRLLMLACPGGRRRYGARSSTDVAVSGGRSFSRHCRRPCEARVLRCRPEMAQRFRHPHLAGGGHAHMRPIRVRPPRPGCYGPARLDSPLTSRPRVAWWRVRRGVGGCRATQYRHARPAGCCQPQVRLFTRLL